MRKNIGPFFFRKGVVNQQDIFPCFYNGANMKKTSRRTNLRKIDRRRADMDCVPIKLRLRLIGTPIPAKKIQKQQY
jgi:hypothetical protein